MDDEELAHELSLAYQMLHGHTFDGIVLIPGMYDKEYYFKRWHKTEEEYYKRLRHDERRYELAINELFERQVLK